MARLVRGALVLAALATLVFLVLTLPVRLEILGSACAGPSDACLGDRQLLTADLPGLQALGLSLRAYAAANVALEWVAAAAFLGVAAALLLRRPGDWYARLACLMLICLSTEPILVMVRNHYEAQRWAYALWEFAGNALLLPVLYLFPDGRFMPRWTAWVAVLSAVPTAGRILWPGSFLDPTHWPVWLGLPAYISVYATPVVAQVYRFRHTTNPLQRQQIKWLGIGAAGMALCILAMASGIVLYGAAPAAVNPAVSKLIYGVFRTLLMLPIPLSLAVAILRYRLWDLDVIIQRTLLYGGLSLGLLGLNVAVVAWLGAALGISGGLITSLVATTLVALLFQPAYSYLQGRISRLMYGDRGEPLAVLTRLTGLLEAPKTPQELLPDLVRTTAQVLRLPYVAVRLAREGGLVVVAQAGEPGREYTAFPLTYQGEALGVLEVATRAPGEPLSAADLNLLTHIAGQAAASAQALRLTEDLQRSRQRIVTAAEEERRRLRRDLHDGLGPALASLTLSLDAALNMLSREQTQVRDLLSDLRDEARTATTDVRRLVYGLRPPALDLGVRAALQDLITAYQHTQLVITLSVPEEIAPLPAAVEVAIYRIAQEALTNVAKHARANQCSIVLEPLPGAVRLEVTDDGQGIGPAPTKGVGLQSMRERAAELGGTCRYEPALPKGTKVIAILPALGGTSHGDR